MLQGCYSLVSNFVVDNMVPIGLGVASAAALHLLGLILACCLARCVRRSDQAYQELS